MPDFRRLSLGQLTLYCPPLRQALSGEEQGAWRELQRRAFLEQNPAAWDALVMRLWPTVLVGIYNYAPELAPAAAALLAQQILHTFKQRYTPMTTSSFRLRHEQLLAELQQLITQHLLKSPPSSLLPPAG